MAVPRPSCADLFAKLDGADLLLVACSMSLPLGLAPRLVTQLRVVHYARHGPVEALREALEAGGEADSEAALASSSHNGFPMLFQPLLEMRGPGWVDRLRVLLQAGAPGDAVYAPWRATALHMLCYTKTGSGSLGRRRVPESQLLEAAHLLLQRGARRVLNQVDQSAAGGGVHQRTALMQAASDGRFQVCLALLEAGADADLVDSQGQSVVDILFYLKHSGSRVHREASAGYSCMDLYGMVNRFQLGGLLTDELREDARLCGTCRYLLASVPFPLDDKEDDEEEQTVAAAESESESSSNQDEHLLPPSHAEQLGAHAHRRTATRLSGLEHQLQRMRSSRKRHSAIQYFTPLPSLAAGAVGTHVDDSRSLSSSHTRSCFATRFV